MTLDISFFFGFKNLFLLWFTLWYFSPNSAAEYLKYETSFVAYHPRHNELKNTT